MIFIMGVWDDLKPWRARYKLLVQVVAALMVISSGFVFRRLGFGNLPFRLELGLVAYPLTFFWIVGVTNAINLIDGIDGLSGSIALLASIAYAFFFYFVGNVAAFYCCVILGLSIVGFLFFNLPFPRARIFMGDGGSQFLGFILAVLPLLQSGNRLATISLPYACAVLSIPICDTIAAIWRRVREKRRIDDPDRFHLHHKLMMLGFSAREALVLIAVLQSIIVTLTVTSAKVPMILSFCLLLCVYALVLLFFTVIHIKKEEELVRRHAREER
jgi:UDP-GlcNAc:undecaprenyl-phosphate GlcNAc-1-phosphate transferase